MNDIEARLKRHIEYWIDPAPGIAARLESVRQLIAAGPRMIVKAQLILEKLDHQRTEQEWNNDPATIEGERVREKRKEGGSVTAEQRQQERQQRADEAARRWDRLTTHDHNSAAIIAKSMGKTPTTVRKYLKQTGRIK